MKVTSFFKIFLLFYAEPLFLRELNIDVMNITKAVITVPANISIPPQIHKATKAKTTNPLVVAPNILFRYSNKFSAAAVGFKLISSLSNSNFKICFSVSLFDTLCDWINYMLIVFEVSAADIEVL